jgi:hypothetical protein
MEGIVDGGAIDSCFYCKLLYPELEPCPRCGNRLRYRSASMGTDSSPEEQVSALLKVFQLARTGANAVALLQLMHRHPEVAQVGDIGDDQNLMEEMRVAFAGDEPEQK